MSKRSRRRARNTPSPQLPPPQPARDPRSSEPDPERLLLDQIAAGELDAHLAAIAAAAQASHELLRMINSQKALATLNVGDRVRINHHASPPTCTVSTASSWNSTITPRSCAYTARSAGSRAARSAARRWSSTASTQPRNRSRPP